MLFGLNYQGWLFWLLLLFGAIFVCWIIFGGQREKHKFVGISPLSPNARINYYLPDQYASYPPDTYNYSPYTPAPSYQPQPLVPAQEHFPIQEPSPSSPPDERCVDYTPQIPPFPTTLRVPAPIPTISNPSSAPSVPLPPRPTGTKWVSESLACSALEEIYGVPFERNIRPQWLTNPETGYPLELDCYHQDLKIGLEYQGKQHYVFPNVFHRTYDEFIRQVRRDQYKIDACDRNGVYLITVPYNIPHNMMKDYIRYYLPEAVMARNQTCPTQPQ